MDQFKKQQSRTKLILLERVVILFDMCEAAVVTGLERASEQMRVWLRTRSVRHHYLVDGHKACHHKDRSEKWFR